MLRRKIVKSTEDHYYQLILADDIRKEMQIVNFLSFQFLMDQHYAEI